mmetsp:Transcript_18797/g.28993  ORF Transcript_18797/g.28993 Transcript_18797/m.28993 type:complete len:351 (+) Transcript_18797:106-1158(+)
MLFYKLGLILGVALGTTSAFVPPQRLAPGVVHQKSPESNNVMSPSSSSLLTLHAEEKKKSKGGVDASMKTKLLAESIAPWRTLRVFFYGAAASGAFLGGMITLAGAAAGITGARTDLDMNTEYLNLAIDFGAVAAFGVLAKLDLDKGSELDENVQKKIDRKKEEKVAAKAMKKREESLANLLLEIQVSTDGTTQEAPVSALQNGARQHMIIVAGPRKACKDALIGANLLKMDFAMSNVLVVPYNTDPGAADVRPSGGFGERPAYETQPYVARTIGEGWEEYIKAEMDDAVAQNGEKTKEEGIAVVIANNGKVIRRGVGKVPWRQMVEQLDDEVRQVPKDEPGIEIPFLSG